MSTAIPLTYLILTILLLWFIIYTKANVIIKAATIVISLTFAVMLWYALPTYAGFSTDDKIPLGSTVIAIKVYEPDKRTGDDGSVHIWATSKDCNEDSFWELLGYKPYKNEPRSYRLKYTDLLRAKLAEMSRALAAGRTVKYGKPLQSEGDSGNGDGANGKEGDGNGGYSGQSYNPEYHFYVLPRPTPQTKE